MITKTLHDNKFIGIYEEYNYRIIAKVAEYNSTLNETYDIITDIKIVNTDNNSIIYEANNIHMAYDKKEYVSIVNYVEKILFYLHNETCDIYWKKLFLDKFFINMNTTTIEIYYNRGIKQQEETKKQEEIKTYRDKIESIKKEIQTKYNNDGIAVIYNLFDMFFINENRIIPRQNNSGYLDTIKNNIETYKPYILNHIELNWDNSDLKILNELLAV